MTHNCPDEQRQGCQEALHKNLLTPVMMQSATGSRQVVWPRCRKFASFAASASHAPKCKVLGKIPATSLQCIAQQQSQVSMKHKLNNQLYHNVTWWSAYPWYVLICKSNISRCIDSLTMPPAALARNFFISRSPSVCICCPASLHTQDTVFAHKQMWRAKLQHKVRVCTHTELACSKGETK